MLGGLAAIQTAVESRGVEAKLGGVALQAGFVQGGLVIEQQIMVLPEFALSVGAFSRLGRLLGIGMYRGQGEVANGEPDLVPVGLLQLVERFITETLAVRSLVIAELYYRHLCVFWAPRRRVIGADLDHGRSRG